MFLVLLSRCLDAATGVIVRGMFAGCGICDYTASNTGVIRISFITSKDY